MDELIGYGVATILCIGFFVCVIGGLLVVLMILDKLLFRIRGLRLFAIAAFQYKYRNRDKGAG